MIESDSKNLMCRLMKKISEFRLFEGLKQSSRLFYLDGNTFHHIERRRAAVKVQLMANSQLMCISVTLQHGNWHHSQRQANYK